MKQVSEESPKTEHELHKSLAKPIPSDLHRALYARAISDDEGGEAPDVPDAPEEFAKAIRSDLVRMHMTIRVVL